MQCKPNSQQSQLFAMNPQLRPPKLCQTVPCSSMDRATSLSLNTSCAQLKGREQETKQLLKAWNRVIETGTPESVLLRGSAGTGKTSLVLNSIASGEVTRQGGYFGFGKFDQIRKSDPYAPLVNAFNAICNLVLERDDDIARVRSRLMESLGENELKVFARLVSGVSSIIETTKTGEDQVVRQEFNMGHAFIRFKQLCRAFLRSISCREHPIVLFIDDIQFGDEKSLEVLQSLMKSTKGLESVLFIVSFRDDPVGPHQDLVDSLTKDKAFTMITTEIEIRNLDRSKVNEMVSDILRLDPDETWDLSGICHLKTMGNPFFLQQYLKFLVSEQLLTLSCDTQSYEWDEVKIQSETNVTGNILEVITERAKHTNPTVRHVLQQASFLGFTFDIEVLQAAIYPDLSDCKDHKDCPPDNTETLMNVLASAQRQGFIESGGCESMCKWTHDRVMQSFQSMVPDDSERAQIHFRIGKRLWQSGLSMSGARQFLIIDQLNLGTPCVSDPDEKIWLATLNLDAGIRSVAKSAFAMGQGYFERGIALLPEDQWIKHHSLTIQLHNLAAEAAYSNGDVLKTMYMVDAILENGVTVEERFPAYITYVNAFSSQGLFAESNRVAQKVLKELSVNIPLEPTILNVMAEFWAVKKLLKGKGDDFIFSLPPMDERNYMALRIMSSVAKSAYFQQAMNLLALVSLRSLWLSLKHGMSDYTAHSLAMYALILSAMKKFNEAYSFGKLANKLMGTMADKKAQARTLTSTYSNCIHIKESLTEFSDELGQGYQTGMELGDIGWALSVGIIHGNVMYFGGTSLSLTESTLRYRYAQAIEFKETCIIPMYQVLLQATLNLLGNVDDLSVLQGEVLTNVKDFRLQHYSLIITILRMFSLITCGFFECWESANEQNCELAKDKNFRSLEGSIGWPFTALFRSLTSIASYRLYHRRKDLSHFRRVKKTAEYFMKCGQSTLAPLIKFMHCEELSLRGSKDAIERAYADAAEAMQHAGYVNLEAVIHERAGNVAVERFADYSSASHSYSLSMRKYSEWGAIAKVDLMRLKIDGLPLTEQERRSAE